MSVAATRRITTVAVRDRTTGAETVLACEPGESVLLAGLRVGLALPYECASGGCGSCRAQLIEGAVTSRWPEATGLTERDRRRGDRILLCQSLPEEDCQVRLGMPDQLVAAALPVPARRTGTLILRTMLSSDTARLIVDVGSPVPYLPGQFVILEFEDGVRRAYSMSRPPQAGSEGELELLIRAKPGGAASRWIFDRTQVGDSFVVEGPFGRAHVQSADDRAVICLAGGTGLAPVLAIAEHLVAQAPGRRMHLYVGARRIEDVVFTGRLAKLAEAGTTVVTVVEQTEDLTHPVLGEIRTGLALGHLAADLPDLSEHDIYLAGPTPMIDAGLRQLLREGTADPDRVFFDRFVV